ncbi:MAG: hypothetical protein K0S47_2315 [Herbinix sp.]|jgi:flagellar protein FliS|nr:hypothetical protein [Herbinix sp.]
MKKEAIQGFTARITQASRSELIVILYEMVLEEMKEAKEAYEVQDNTAYVRELKRAQKYVSELMAVLDYRYSIAYELLQLYYYVNKCIITAIYKKSIEDITKAETVMKKLLIGFEGVSKEDKSGPMMKNTQQLYAGLTYGKGKLNETYLDPNNRSRGFIA